MSEPPVSLHAPGGRRHFLASVGTGMGLLALRAMAAEQSSNPLAPRQPAFRPKARRLIHLFMNGGPSHIDSFDPKPELAKYAGKPLPGPRLLTERATGSGFPSPFRFFPRGQSGLPVSDLFPRVAECADLLCVVRSMQSDTPNHEPALMLMNCGEQRQMRPSMGAWLVHGLGTECANLPGFVSLCPGGLPIQEGQNWQNAFLPAACQGTHLDTLADSPNQWIENLANQAVTPRTQRAQLALARKLAALSPNSLPADPRLEGRLGSMELAFRMQWEASDALDLAREDQSTRDLYGDTVQGRQMLLARRLIEAGVRFVTIQGYVDTGIYAWDHHWGIFPHLDQQLPIYDNSYAALLKDLDDRGLLDTTLVITAGEFGRTPRLNYTDKRGPGRDHWGKCFSLTMGGGGIRTGQVIGASDKYGAIPEKRPVSVPDFVATVYQALGLDPQAEFVAQGRPLKMLPKGTPVSELF